MMAVVVRSVVVLLALADWRLTTDYDVWATPTFLFVLYLARLLTLSFPVPLLLHSNGSFQVD